MTHHHWPTHARAHSHSKDHLQPPDDFIHLLGKMRGRESVVVAGGKSMNDISFMRLNYLLRGFAILPRILSSGSCLIVLLNALAKYFGYLRCLLSASSFCVNNLWILARLLFCIIYGFIICLFAATERGVAAGKDFVLILIKSTDRRTSA